MIHSKEKSPDEVLSFLRAYKARPPPPPPPRPASRSVRATTLNAVSSRYRGGNTLFAFERAVCYMLAMARGEGGG